MVDIRRKFDLYVALRKILHKELAAWLLWELSVIEERPDLQRRNNERFRTDPASVYALYAEFTWRIGREPTVTMLEMLDPIGWGVAGESTGPSFAANDAGGDHGG